MGKKLQESKKIRESELSNNKFGQKYNEENKSNK
jgi:hypothetical protein